MPMLPFRCCHAIYASHDAFAAAADAADIDAAACCYATMPAPRITLPAIIIAMLYYAAAFADFHYVTPLMMLPLMLLIRLRLHAAKDAAADIRHYAMICRRHDDAHDSLRYFSRIIDATACA